MTLKYTSKQLDAFSKAASSLKLFSRAELSDDKQRSLIEKLYVDPLPNDQILKTLLASNTTLLVGRKGTGKSTVFQRAQHELRKHNLNAVSAYMDIRNVYESSQIDQATIDKISGFQEALSVEQVKKLLLYKRFFFLLIKDMKIEIEKQISRNFLTRIQDQLKGTSQEVMSGLDRILERLDNAELHNITGTLKKAHAEKAANRSGQRRAGQASGSISVGKVEGTLKIEGENTSGQELATEENFAELFMRWLNLSDVINEIQVILSAIDVKNLYIFLDDFSELPDEAMRILVDALISPLARWSDFIKFKIAAYPGRVYLGSLDITKIEEIHLDIYKLYGSNGVKRMEEKAIDFTRRVVERRLSHFCKADSDLYLNVKTDDFWRVLFYATMSNPRIIGHILLYSHESHLIYHGKVGIQAIQDAAQRYYEEKVLPFFANGAYLYALNERSSIYSLKELLESVVQNARTLRQEDRSRSENKGRGRAYASHFYVNQEFEELLTSLELSFFITKYFEQSDRTGARVGIYALNYGLCNKYQIGFGRPAEKREDRLYFVDRTFDYNPTMVAYVRNNQEITCESCNQVFDAEMMPALKLRHMKCLSCGTGICSVINLSKKYGELLESIGRELLLPETELGILQTLQIEDREMVASEIAEELDCSGQLVGRRAKNLFERSLITRQSGGGNIFKYELTEKAKEAYFSRPELNDLSLDT
jgi:DNA-binding MarR family transcriptional regulator